MRKQENMIEQFFKLRQGDLLEEMGEDREILKNSLKQINNKRRKLIRVKNKMNNKILNIKYKSEDKNAIYNSKKIRIKI